MNEENKTLDQTVPELESAEEKQQAVQNTAAPATQPAQSAQASQSSQNSRNDKANNLRELAENASITAYAFIGDLKAKGHNSLGDLIFRDTMTMMCSASLASESIGKDKFTEFLEKGFYATGRLLVYLNFAGTLDVNESVREMLIDSITGVHRIFAASLRTVRKSQTRQMTNTVI